MEFVFANTLSERHSEGTAKKKNVSIPADPLSASLHSGRKGIFFNKKKKYVIE